MVESANDFISAFLIDKTQYAIGIVEVRMTLLERGYTPSLHLRKNKVLIVSKAFLDEHFKRGGENGVIIS